MDDEFIACYSDIIFSENVVRNLMANGDDIAINADIDWTGYYEGRTEHPIEEAENVIYDGDNTVAEIGKIVDSIDAVNGEFIGMVKCSKSGAEIFREYFNRAKNDFWRKPFMRAKTFDVAYLTDFIQYLVNNSINVKCVEIEQGWMEIDTVQDFERAEKMISSKAS